MTLLLYIKLSENNAAIKLLPLRKQGPKKAI